MKKLKFHATLAPSKQLTSYSSVTETAVEAEPVYANLPSPPPPAATTTNNVSPPRVTSLTASGERTEGFGVAGTRDLLNKKAGSREPIAGANLSYIIINIIYYFCVLWQSTLKLLFRQFLLPNFPSFL